MLPRLLSVYTPLYADGVCLQCKCLLYVCRVCWFVYLTGAFDNYIPHIMTLHHLSSKTKGPLLQNYHTGGRGGLGGSAS